MDQTDISIVYKRKKSLDTVTSVNLVRMISEGNMRETFIQQ